MRFTTLTGLLIAIGLAILLPQSLTAQNEEGDNPSAEETETRGPLPDYFGKLGLSDPQRDKLYAIQDSYEERIEALQKQINDLENERDQSMETLLTPGQKLRLKELRDEARRKEQADAGANESGTADPAASPQEAP